MTIQEKKAELKKYYSDSKFSKFQTDDLEHLIQIDFDSEIVYYYVYVTASCGCCSETQDRETDLDSFLEYLTLYDYETLLEELKG